MFRAWLRAAHRRSLAQAREEDLVEFMALRPGDQRRRERMVRADLVALGAQVTPVADHRLRIGHQLRDPHEVETVLEKTDVDDTLAWGVRVRRDAALLGLLRLPGLRRAEVTNLAGGQVQVDYRPGDTDTTVLVRGRRLPRAEPARSCPACAFTLWLGCVSVHDSRGRYALPAFLGVHARSWTHGHLCDDVESVAGTGWQTRTHLIPATGPGGFIEDQGLSTRQVTRIVSSYLDPVHNPGTLTPKQSTAGQSSGLTPREVHARNEDLGEWVGLLEEATDQAAAQFDEVMKLIEAL